MKFTPTLFTLLALATAVVAAPADTQERDTEQRGRVAIKWWIWGYDDNYDCGDGCNKIYYQDKRSKVTYQCGGESWTLQRDTNNQGTISNSDGSRKFYCFINNNDDSIVCY